MRDVFLFFMSRLVSSASFSAHTSSNLLAGFGNSCSSTKNTRGQNPPQGILEGIGSWRPKQTGLEGSSPGGGFIGSVLADHGCLVFAQQVRRECSRAEKYCATPSRLISRNERRGGGGAREGRVRTDTKRHHDPATRHGCDWYPLRPTVFF